MPMQLQGLCSRGPLLFCQRLEQILKQPLLGREQGASLQLL